MASPLSQFQMVKDSSERLLIAIDDVNDLWESLKEGFEARVPFRKASLNNKARNLVLVDRLHVEYVQTTDARIRRGFPGEQTPLPLWFRRPYACVVLATCDDLDEYKNLLKPRLKSIVQNEDREWLIIFVSKSLTDNATKLSKKVYAKVESDFNSKKRERCCRLELHEGDPSVWDEIEFKIVECIRNTLDHRVQYYEEEVRKLSENRFMPAWDFCNFFIVKESLAFMFEMANLQEDALREYDELEQIYLEMVNAPNTKTTEFGGLDTGDDRASLLDSSRKSFSQFAHGESVREFDFRQYLFSRQAQLLQNLQRPAEVSSRGHSFIISFSKTLTYHEKELPFCMREVWVITACLALVKATSQRFTMLTGEPDGIKDFYRLQGDLYSYARTKLMRLADLIGYGHNIETSPCNSAALSMLPWPKPAVWPAVPRDVSLVLAKEKRLSPGNREGLGKLRKQLSISPTVLLREANRRRASLSAGNLAEMLELSRVPLKERSNIATDGSPAADGSAGPASPSTAPQLRPPSPGLPPPISGALQRPPSIDPPMRLPEVQAAAEHALLNYLTDEQLRKALSSVEGFEEFYLELTRAAADNFHHSWRKRHGVVLDGEVASVHYRHGAFDSAMKLYEKVCALYASERWHALLAEVLPRLSDCQKQLSDWAGYLSSCVKLLSLDPGVLSDEERHSLQSDILKNAHGGLKIPVSLDVSALITFAAKGGPPLELCEGDPGTLMVTVWSGFAEEITMDSLSLTLITTFSADEGTKVVKSVDSPVLRPGKNSVIMVLPPQRPGSYVLGVLTGHIGQVRLRSHTYCSTSAASSKGGPPDSDDYLSFEKPLRTVLEVSKPRALVEVKPAVAKGLLVGQPQWVGLIIRPLNYSLKGAYVHISAGQGLHLEGSQPALLEISAAFQPEAHSTLPNTEGPRASSHSVDHRQQGIHSAESEENLTTENPPDASFPGRPQRLEYKNGKVELLDWASTVASVLWIQVQSDSDSDVSAVSAGSQQLPSSPPSPVLKHLLSDATHISTSLVGLHRSLSLGTSAKETGAAAQCVPEGLENGTVGYKLPVMNGSLSSKVGVRTLNVKIEFGASRSRLYDRAISLQFTDPFRLVNRVVSRGNDGTLLLQVTLISQVATTATIMNARLVLQPGFVHMNNSGGQPTPAWLSPLSISANSEGALLFVVRSDAVPAKYGIDSLRNGSCEGYHPMEKSVLTLQYKISGDEQGGVHALVRDGLEKTKSLLNFSGTFFLKMPVLEQLVAVGMLPIPSQCPRVGQQVVFQWRVERLKEGRAASQQQRESQKNVHLTKSYKDQDSEELYYELKANEEYWMIAGRRKGHISLPQSEGSRFVLSMACVPLLAGHVHPPALRLANIGRAHISHSPAGPHLVCVLPPAPCSALCVMKII